MLIIFFKQKDNVVFILVLPNIVADLLSAGLLLRGGMIMYATI